MRKIFLVIRLTISITILIFMNVDCFCQSINKTWVCDKTKTCIEFDSLTSRLNINDFYSNYKEGKFRFEYKIKEKAMNIIWYNNQSLFGLQKEISCFKILKLTNDTLSLKLIKKNDQEAIPELLGDSLLLFKQMEINCSDYIKKNKNIH